MGINLTVIIKVLKIFEKNLNTQVFLVYNDCRILYIYTYLPICSSHLVYDVNGE
jgi:hypothetical protein